MKLSASLVSYLSDGGLSVAGVMQLVARAIARYVVSSGLRSYLLVSHKRGIDGL